MSLLRNSTIVVTGVIISNLLAYIFHFVVGRTLGPKDYGAFGALMSLFLMVALPGGALSFAITKYTSRFFAEDELAKIAFLRRRIQRDVLAFSITMLFVVVIFSQLISNFLKIGSNMSIIIVGITLVFALLLPINNGLVLGLKKYQILSWNIIIEASSRLALLFLFLYLGFGVNGALLAYGLAYCISFFWVFPFLKETRSKIGVDMQIPMRSIYRFIFQILFVNIILQSIINIPSLIIKHYYSSEFTGYWTAALNISRISIFVTSAISLVMFPEIAGEKDNQIKKKIFGRATILVLLASSVIALTFLIIPQFLIHMLYGKAFLDASSILKWMGFAMILIGWLQLWANYLLARLE